MTTQGHKGLIDRVRGLGVRRSAVCAFDLACDLRFDLAYGTDTWSRVEMQSLAFTSKSKEKALRYESTRTRPFNRLMAAVRPPKSSTFVDIGAGKGRALILAGMYGFEKVVGIEFSPELCSIARENIERVRKKCGLDAAIEIVEADILDYQMKSEENIYYMYNPFGSEMTEKIAGMITDTLVMFPRKLTFIYGWPAHEKLFEKLGVFREMKRYEFHGAIYGVYAN